ncbi:MAG TPA: hypothetical protein VKS25_03605 [Solirubrobacteraceae bacterium]|nr:hypothetical protein [Solirubrobacteraceae bacterium]
MATPLLPSAPAPAAGNGATHTPVPSTHPAAVSRDERVRREPRSALLAKLTSLTSIATVAAAGMIVVGVLAVVGGNYDKQVVHDQLAPQQIFFPKPASNPALAAYAGQQVLTGHQAKLYAEDQIGVDLTKVAGGKTFSQISAAWIAGGEKNATLASERTTLFTGETLRGLLLNAWGWSLIGTLATLAGIILMLLGAVLLLLPLANWRLNLRGGQPATNAT